MDGRQLWDVADGDIEATGLQPAAAAAIVDQLSRRDELRAAHDSALGNTLDAEATVVGIGIGLLGAIPATPLDEAAMQQVADALGMPGLMRLVEEAPGPAARKILGVVGAATNDFDLGAATSEAGGPAGVASAAGQFFDRGVDVGELLRRGSAAASAQGDFVEVFLVPDGEDVFGAGLVRVLSDRYCARRGWRKGERSFHELKFLTYTVLSIAGAYWNPNPFAFGVAAWHLVQALRATRRLTSLLLELHDAAMQDGRSVMDTWGQAVRDSAWTDEQVAVALAVSTKQARASRLRTLSLFDGGE